MPANHLSADMVSHSNAKSRASDSSPAFKKQARKITFSGLWLPLITPFLDDAQRSVDYPSLVRLVEHYRCSGIAGLVVCGSTGEAAALGERESWQVLATVLNHAQGLPVVMGVGGKNLNDALAATRQACDHDISGLLVAPPYYIRPSQTGLVQWFESIANTSTKPIILYDIPYRTGVEITLATLQTISVHPRIVALKDCGGNAAKTQHLIAAGVLDVLAGEDMQIFNTLASGGTGAITASAHLCTEQFAAVVRLVQDGKLAQARQIWHTLLPLISEAFAEPNPAKIKSALAQLGYLNNVLRQPMQVASTAFDLTLLGVSTEKANSP